MAQDFSWLCASSYGTQGLSPGSDLEQVTYLASEVMKGCQMLLNLTGLHFNNCTGDPGLEPQSTRVLCSQIGNIWVLGRRQHLEFLDPMFGIRQLTFVLVFSGPGPPAGLAAM